MARWVRWGQWARWGESSSQPALTFTISGTVYDSSGDPFEAVTVTLSGEANDSTVTDENGQYSFTVSPGNYALTPSSEDEETFSPETRPVVVLTSNVVEEDFSVVFAIFGHILDGVDAAIEAVTVTLSGDAEDSTTTNGDGWFEFSGLSAGEYTITPTLADWQFVEESYTDEFDSDEDLDGLFVGTYFGWSISGTILDLDGDPLEGATVDLTQNFGSAEDSTTTDENGEYSFSGLANGSYRLLPSGPSETASTWEFNADEITDAEIADGDLTEQNFEAALYLDTPFEINFEGETAGQTPTWVDTRNGFKAPYIEAQSVEGLTKCLRFDAGSGATLGYGSINFNAYLGAPAKAMLKSESGFKVRLLEYREGTTNRQTVDFADVSDLTDETPAHRVYIQDKEEDSPDDLRYYLVVDEVVYDSGEVAQGSINNSTGATWRYSLVTAASAAATVYVYNTDGAQQGTAHSTGMPSGGSVPSKDLRYLHGTAGAAFFWRWEQIWVGVLGDDFPAM